MTLLRIAEVARLLRVSDDTVRRWIDAGRLALADGASGRKVVAGEEVARFVRAQREGSGDESADWPMSARNRFEGIVTDVQRDGLVAQVEVQAGPFRIVSLMTREAVDELGLEPGSLASAIVKSTSVIVQATPGG
ncbi:MAG: TOBE domain-containing protein [Frankiales bacterium]|nr:TOBE domain-containing protein [Frankiales bacterium]